MLRILVELVLLSPLFAEYLLDPEPDISTGSGAERRWAPEVRGLVCDTPNVSLFVYAARSRLAEALHKELVGDAAEVVDLVSYFLGKAFQQGIDALWIVAVMLIHYRSRLLSTTMGVDFGT